MQKRIYIIVIAVLFVGCCVLGGVSYYTARKAGELDIQARELREANERIAGQLSDANGTIERLNGEITEARRTAQDLTEQLARTYDTASNITTGLSDIGEGISGVLSEMRAFAEASNPPD